MNREIKTILQQIYADHTLLDPDLDYTLVDRYAADLERLSLLSDRCFFIVDLHTFKYIYTSSNFKNIWGCLPTKESDSLTGDQMLDSKIHPDDFFDYQTNLLRVGSFLMQKDKEERTEYRHVFEFRIRNLQQQYVRVSWERQPLQTDAQGNLWLMLGTVHVLSDQDSTDRTKSFFIHLKTGRRIPFDNPQEPPFALTARERQVLQLMQQGLLSKEMADKLSISVNTVNIHRQNILHKMQVNNSLEAVGKGRRSGILK